MSPSPLSLDPKERRATLLAAETTRYSRRKLVNSLISGLMLVLTVLSVLVLFVILYFILSQGIAALFPTNPDTGQISFNLDFFTKPPITDLQTGEVGGGVVQAILGTIEVLLVAGVFAVPIGLGTAIYLSEYGRGPLARVVNFTIDLLAGLPSVVVGLFILSALIGQLSLFNVFKQQGGLPGALALMVIMVPIIARSVEQILRLVPNELREAGLALGMPKWRVVLRIVLPTVAGGIATGVMLSLARAAGETAPILLTMLGNEFINFDLLQPTDALPLRIYKNVVQGLPSLLPKAYASTMILVVVIAFFSIAVRYVTGRNRYDS